MGYAVIYSDEEFTEYMDVNRTVYSLVAVTHVPPHFQAVSLAANSSLPHNRTARCTASYCKLQYNIEKNMHCPDLHGALHYHAHATLLNITPNYTYTAF